MNIPSVDIVIPVYNEGENILAVLKSLRQSVKSPYRVLICYDSDNDNTLQVLQNYAGREGEVVPVKNRFGAGPHGAVRSGFAASIAPAIIMLPADDNYNAPMLDKMVSKFKEGADIVCASRFIPGGCMEGCPFLKKWLVRIAAFTLRYVALLPTRDATNGFRLFSRRVVDSIVIESTQGFTYSIELLVKAHRLGWKITDVPAEWHQRQKGQSRFKVLNWLFPYLRWYFYGFATTYLHRGPNTVRLLTR